MRRDDDDFAGEEDALEAFATLPRERPLGEGETDRMVATIRREGLLAGERERNSRSLALLGMTQVSGAGMTRAARASLIAAAAMLVFAIGAFAGSAYTRRGSLEDALDRQDLTVTDRVLLLQRAGSAYVRAAQGYADATTRADSTAVEVASQVLVGAANAVARHGLDAGMAARIAEVLKPPMVVPAAAQRKPLIWF